MAMIVWGCCPAARRYIGTVVEVKSVETDSASCPRCGHETVHGRLAVIDFNGPTGLVPVAWLRKMPPPEERIDVEETEEVGA